MGRKGMNEADHFSKGVIEQVQEAITASGMSNAEVIKRSHISQDYFYTRMRGEKPFNTNDISKIAEVLGVDAFGLLIKAGDIASKLASDPKSFDLASDFDPNKEAERKMDDFGA